MNIQRLSQICTVVFSLALLPSVSYAQSSNVSINGVWLSLDQVSYLEQQLGTRVNPGHYLVNYNNGCWANLTSGESGCITQPQSNTQQAGVHVGRGGSGEWNGEGDWSYYNNHAGTGVGGTSDGCIYAGDWSNC